jgi:two-component system, NtrC family, sensor kinase
MAGGVQGEPRVPPAGLPMSDGSASPAPTPAAVVGPAPGDNSLTAWLRAVLWGAFLFPSMAFALAVLWGYERAYKEAEDTVAHASALALRNAQRTFQIAAEIARRADDAASGADADVHAREAQVHQRLADMSAGLQSIVNVNVWDANGRPLVRSDKYPVDPSITVADRAYFIEQREQPRALGIGEVIKGRQTGLELVNATVRRSAPDGAFAGVVAVSLAPGFFRDYYRSLAAEQPNLTNFALIRTDGALLARFPPLTDGRSKVRPNNPVFARVRAGETSGIEVLESTEEGQVRLVSFRRVGDLPVYVTAGVSRSAMLAGWFHFVAVLAAIIMPTTLVLVYVSWVALKKTRRELAISAELQDQIRRRAKAELVLLETQKLEALSQLTGGVAHDFNNLLTIVSNGLHLLGRKHPELKDERQLESMSRAVKSGVRLTRQLLSFSRKQALRPETVALQQWLPATQGLLASTLGGSIALHFSVDPDTRPVTVDLAELELALINAALNAQHAMPHGGSLRVTACNLERDGAALVVIRVEDDGAGIPPELLKKVFEPFYTTKGPGKGSGLGLSQVYGLCAQAGGYAAIESTVGRGSTLSLYFPAAVAEVATVEVHKSEATGLLRGRVLLVEDNDDVARATESLLRSAGLEVTRAANADAALAALTDHAHPDILFSDISMPGSMDGIGLAFAVRTRWPALPLILTTGYAERIDEAIAGGFRVLTKPVAPDEVLSELGALLARRPGPTATLPP